MAVIGVLVLLAMPKFMGYTEKARLTEIKSNIKQLENASERYYIKEQDWPRAFDTPYTAEEIEAFTQEIMDRTGAVVTLDPNGNYYPISYSKLQKYVQEPKDGVHYILQNPVGEVFYLDSLTEIGELELDKKENKYLAVITMNPGDELYPASVIEWSSSNSILPEGDSIINEEWVNKKDSYPVGTHTVKLRIQNQNGKWSNWASKTFTIKPTKTLSFNGSNSYISLLTETVSAISNNFTYEFWVKPEATQPITSQTNTGASSLRNFRMVIGAAFGGNDSGAGISVGTNGITVLEHGASYFTTPLVYNAPISDWTHIAVVYKDKTPYLYVNGVFVKKGLTSQKTVHPSTEEIGRGGTNKVPHSYFKGEIKDITLWNYSKTEYEIKRDKDTVLTGNESGLQIWFPLNESTSSNIYNTANNNRVLYGTLKNGEWQ